MAHNITRTKNLSTLESATDPYKAGLMHFSLDDWINTDFNIALANEDGDVALFEYYLPGVVTGHYFFKARARQAVKVAKEMLEELFTGDYDVKVIRGLTPLEKLGARWMNKQLKFNSYGVVQTEAGPCELVILTKEEWSNNNE